MAGVLLETLSNKKLIGFGVSLLLLQVVFFLVGGLIAPSPSYVHQILGTICVAPLHEDRAAWYVLRGTVNNTCHPGYKVDNLDDAVITKNNVTANDIVFTFQMPLPRDDTELDMSRWFQSINSVIHIETNNQHGFAFKEDAELTMDARLGYRDKSDGSHWTELVHSIENRQLKCHVKEENATNEIVACEMLPLFELGSCHYDYYILNIRLPIKDFKNADIGKIEDIWLYAIHQNGGFTKVWFSLKTVLFPTILVVLIWFCMRLQQMERSVNLLERTLIAVGLALSLLNLPVEWFTLWIHMPYMLLYSDIRQGVFYTVLFCFWIIFTGEHLMDSLARDRLVSYWKHLAVVGFACICLFIFEMCERGVQLTNPFYTIWSTETSSNIAYAFIILAGIAACTYFVFLCYMVFRVYRNISAKKSALPTMRKARRKFYLGLIFRFKFLMLSTLLCAACTVIFFIVGQVSEGQWKWGETQLEYTSAFMTGVYGMWNLYVFALMILYAPSTKYMRIAEEDDSNEEAEQIEFTTVPCEASQLAAFAQKAAAD